MESNANKEKESQRASDVEFEEDVPGEMDRRGARTVGTQTVSPVTKDEAVQCVGDTSCIECSGKYGKTLSVTDKRIIGMSCLAFVVTVGVAVISRCIQ